MKKRTPKKTKGKTAPIEKIEGVLSVTAKGYGFVDISERNGIFVSKKHFNGAFHGDLVEARVFSRKGKAECEITRVLERRLVFVTGICVRNEGRYYLEPCQDNFGILFEIKKAHLNGAKEGDLIIGEIINYQSEPPRVYLTEVLGAPHKSGNDMALVMRKYGISEQFPPEVSGQEVILPTEEEFSLRKDFTNQTVITIDGDDAKDLDDAVSVVKQGSHYLLGVHIADVSYYVKPRTPIDFEAYHRGTSVYFPDRVAPMLPKSLSNELCSLHPGEKKLTFSCVMEFDESGNLVSYELMKSYIQSAKRTTYSKVKDFLSGKAVPEYEPIRETLELLYELYQKRKHQREKAGFVAFDFPETAFWLDNDGKPIQVFPREVSFANEMIEEFMLAANICVAEFARENSLPFVYRVHGTPDTEKIESLYQTLKVLGIPFERGFSPTPGELNRLLQKTKETEYEAIVHQLTLRSMQKAVYSPVCSGHYGLNFESYCHFTSPIRRYPDLLIHRILSEYLAGKSVKKYQKFVGDAAEHSSQTELNAFFAEREADDVKKALYMSDRIGETFSGTICSLTETGFFVSLPNTVEGFVPLVSLDEYYEYFPQEFLFRAVGSGSVLKIGQAVLVTVVRCDVLAGKIEFSLEKN